ncbi:MAG: (Fe-S)-binding protein [Bilophila wadsworthia]
MSVPVPSGCQTATVLAVCPASSMLRRTCAWQAVLEALPGANYGGCGYAGCEGYATAVATPACPRTAAAPEVRKQALWWAN